MVLVRVRTDAITVDVNVVVTMVKFGMSGQHLLLLPRIDKEFTTSSLTFVVDFGKSNGLFIRTLSHRLPHLIQ